MSHERALARRLDWDKDFGTKICLYSQRPVSQQISVFEDGPNSITYTAHEHHPSRPRYGWQTCYCPGVEQSYLGFYATRINIDPAKLTFKSLWEDLAAASPALVDPQI